MTEPALYDIFESMRKNRVKWHGRYIEEVRRCSLEEDFAHKDVIVMFKGESIEFYDAKHQDDYYKGGMSYSVSPDIVKFIEGKKEINGKKIDGSYYFALMEYDRRYIDSFMNPIIKPTNRFVILPMNKCKLTKRNDYTTVVDILENESLKEWLQ